MSDAMRLRAVTLVMLLSTSSSYALLACPRLSVQSLYGHQRYTRPSPSSRGRPARLCAIAVDRNKQVGLGEGRRPRPDREGLKHSDQDAAGFQQSAAQQAITDKHARTSTTARQQDGGEGIGSKVRLSGVNKSGDIKHSRGKAIRRAAGAVALTSPLQPSTSNMMSNSPSRDDQAQRERSAGGDDDSNGLGSEGRSSSAGIIEEAGGSSTRGASIIRVESTKEASLFAGDAERAAQRAAEDVTAVAAAVQAAVAEQKREDENHEALQEEDTERVVSLEMGQRWKRRINFVARTVQIWAFLFHVLLKLLRQKLVQRDEAMMSARRRKLGKYLCRAFLKLGPTLIKIGQLLSTRVDLLSTEYIEELRQLQDDVPGFGGAKAMEIVEEELGAPVSELFDTFDSTPLAAASLGQVHEAWLDGKRYAVKVQRPGLKDLFEVDLKSIGAVAAVLDRFDPKLDGASRDWGAIFRESSRVLYEEVDYTREGRNAERFSENFKGTEWIKAPKINWARSTRKVLCMEFLEGIKITEVEKISAAGIDPALLARRTAECYLAQLCRHGFFHCDPHPGNLACDAVAGGRIIFYDFGMMDELSMPLKRGLVNLIFGIYGNDVKEVVDSLEDMDVIRKGADRMTVERVTRFYLGEFQTTLTKGGKYINQLDPEEEKALVRRERAQIGKDLISGQAAVPLQFPASFTFVFRAFTTLDGIGKTLDPAYDLTKIASPYLKELLDLKDGSAYVSVLKNWQKRLGWRGQDVASVVQSARRVQHVNDVVTQLERGDLRLRVRVLESEEALARIEAVQGSLTAAVMATLLLNAGVMLASGATTGAASFGSRALFAMAGIFGLQIPAGYFQVWRMKRQTQSVKGFR